MFMVYCVDYGCIDYENIIFEKMKHVEVNRKWITYFQWYCKSNILMF